MDQSKHNHNHLTCKSQGLRDSSEEAENNLHM